MKRYLTISTLFLTGCISFLQQVSAQSNTPGTGTKVQSVSSGMVYTPSAYPQNMPLNRVLTVQPQRPYTVLSDVMSDTRIVDEARKNITYTDGFGRTLQSVDWQSTPGKKDLVSPKVYDGFGREAYQFLPYASTANDAAFRSDPFTEQYNFYTGSYTSQQPALGNEQLFYSKTKYEPSPLHRVTSSFAPGNSWVGTEGATNERAAKVNYLINDNSDNVKNWTIAYSSLIYSNDDASTNVPSVLRDYSPGELAKTVSIDEKGFQVIDYTDLNGHTILHKVQTDASSTNAYIGWLCTYYVYDDFGRLRVTIAPNMVEKMAQANSWSISQVQLNGLCFRYEYDQRGRQSASKSPGKAWVYVVYDQKDRQVFVQDGNLAGQSSAQWLGTLYDELNRPIQTGVLYYSGNRSQLQTLVDAQGTSTASHTISVHSQDSISSRLVISDRQPGRPLYKATAEIVFIGEFTSEATAEFTAKNVDSTHSTYSGTQMVNGSPIPSGTTFIPLRYNFYDNYSFTNKNFTPAYNSQLSDIGSNPYADAVSSQATLLVNGMLTGTRVKVIENPNDLSKGGWMEDVNFYDALGRSLQMQGDNYKGGVEIITHRYGFLGQAINSYQIHNNLSANITNMGVRTNWNYDHVGRLLDIRKNVNSAPERTIVKYVYDAMGQLLTKKVGQKRTNATTLSTDPIEEQQYSYNIRGWLKGINWDYTSDATRTKPLANKWFAMDLSYDWGFTNSQYNGSITGQRWQGGGDKAERAFGYGYDGANRFLKADFRQYFSGWTNSDGSSFTIDYSVKMGSDGFTSGNAYDANGNIQRMQQWGLKLNQSPQVDDITYHYTDDNNLLKNVIDGNNDTQTVLGDFRTSSHHPDAANTSASRNDYTFDRNGNIIKDLNKDLGNASNNGVEYNPYTGLPYRIKKYDPAVSGGITSDIIYIYDAAGTIQEKRLTKTTVDAGVTKQVITVTTYLGGFVYENNVLQFFGHEEGRVRFAPILGATTPDIRFDYFIKDHLSNTRAILSDEWKTDVYQAGIEDAYRQTEIQLFAKVPETETAKPGGFDTDNGNQKVAAVNANSADSRIGPNTVLKVMAGDVVRIRAQSWYLPSGNIDPNNGLGSIVANLLSTLSAGVQGASLGKASSAQLTSNNILVPPIDPLIAGRSYDNTRPKAYLNWIVLDDEQYKSVSGNCGFVQVPQISGSQSKQVVQANSGDDITIQKNGYLYVFVSNESYTNVYFDDIRVEHQRGPLLEENNYYPYGLKMAGISSKAALSLQNNFAYQAAYSEHDEETGYNEFELRHYDAQVGRWTGADPYEQFATPYSGMGNDPVNGVDPDGGFSLELFKSGFLTAASNVAISGAVGYGLGYLLKGEDGAKWGAGIGLGISLGSYIPWNDVGDWFGKFLSTGNGAWRIINQWNSAFIDKFRENLSDQLETLSQKGDKFTCDDLALQSIIDFSRKNRLPFVWHTGNGIYDAGDPRYNNAKSFLLDVKAHSGAPDFSDDANTTKVDLQNIKPGTLNVLTKIGNPVPNHVQVISSVSKNANGQVENFGASQGNFRGPGYIWNRATGSDNPTSWRYLGVKMQRGVYSVTSNKWVSPQSGTTSNFIGGHYTNQYRDFNFLNFNR